MQAIAVCKTKGASYAIVLSSEQCCFRIRMDMSAVLLLEKYGG